MSRVNREKTVKRKVPIVINSAKIINERYEKGEINNDDAITQMKKFVQSGNFKSYWFDIDELIRQNHETENWFWLIRRIRNIIHEL